ncbi:hypothetical protein FNV43_RR12325 [Rhamnella rubrinervis]|uniref:Uncharacterized protein n=1 Tax=Rhamnella rubrinervis TaxID=2594499 RepID=A0A8K0H7J1_9ROSA|nr:hypothetical protein FNV43_RR12325 [Rhamnella rubrinervis]
MDSKEALHVEENTDLSQDSYEEEETLSLRDLPVHNSSSGWDVESSWSDNNGNDDGFFKFFSEHFTASTYLSLSKGVIFCGKLVPYKELIPPLLLPHGDLETTQNHLQTNNNKKKLPNKEGFQLWKLVRSSFSNSKGSKTGENISSSKPQQVVKANFKNSSYDYNTRKSTNDHHLSVGKASVLSSPEKYWSRWYFYMFGTARLPTEMKLKDIKWRQSRRSPSTMFMRDLQVEDQVHYFSAFKRSNLLIALYQSCVRVN